MFSTLRLTLCIVLVAAWAAVAQRSADPGAVVDHLPEDAKISESQDQLLSIAMRAVSKMPTVPHLKNRCRAQQQVVRAALQLDQPRRAHRYMYEIHNWRRGAAAAEIAVYLARHKHTQGIESYLKLAEASAELADQDWRKETIEFDVAKARWLMGQPQAAEAFRRGVQEDMHRGRVEAMEAAEAGDEQYEQMMARLDQLIAVQRFELILNASEALANLYRVHYANAERREVIETKLRSAYEKMPGPETLDMLALLAEAALSNDDPAKARAFLDEAKTLLEQIAWSRSAEYEYVYRSKLAKLRFAAGEPEAARQALDAALAELDRRLEKIVDIWRADALRPIAEAYATIGATDQALEVYEKAIRQGAKNPNSRPKADDLALTCISMALNEAEPSDTLWPLIRQTNRNLGPPW